MKPELFALITAMLWGVGGYFEKQGLHQGHFSPQMGITIRTLVALIILSAVSFPHWKTVAQAGARPLLYMAIGGGVVAGSVGMLCFYAAIKGAPLNRVLPIAFTSPLFGALMGCLFGGETLGTRGALGIALTIGGIVLLTTAGSARGMDLPDIRSVETDLQVPSLSEGQPWAGKRVRQMLSEYEGTDVHHILYLPTDWHPGKRYPIIVEYAGNQWRNDRTGDACTGQVEDSKLGYGMSGGRGFIWICMPYVNAAEKRNEATWWGDVDATVDYCKKTVRHICEKWCGDASSVILTGFSRGAIACNYIGLHDDEIADLWLAFVPYSHYDGVRSWPYAESDRSSALERLERLAGRAVFVCQEGGVEATRQYIESTGVKAPFTYQPIGFRNHNDAWVLRPIPERQALRTWLKYVLEARPGRGREEEQP